MVTYILAMRLSDYLSMTKKTLPEFAKEVGVSRQAMHRYIDGERTPRPEKMQRIKEATKGAVTADDFLPAREAAA